MYSKELEKIAEKVNISLDTMAIDELVMYIENDAQLYRQQHVPIYLNLIKKLAKGQYDSNKAVKLFSYLVENGAKKYTKDFGSPGDKLFPKAEKEAAAKALRDTFENDLKTGDLDNKIEEAAVKAIQNNKDALKEFVTEIKKMPKKDISKEIIDKYKKTKKSSVELVIEAYKNKKSVTDELKYEAKDKMEKIIANMFLQSTGKYLEKSEIDKIKKEYKNANGSEDKVDYDLLRDTIDKVIKAPGEKE